MPSDLHQTTAFIVISQIVLAVLFASGGLVAAVSVSYEAGVNRISSHANGRFLTVALSLHRLAMWLSATSNWTGYLCFVCIAILLNFIIGSSIYLVTKLPSMSSYGILFCLVSYLLAVIYAITTQDGHKAAKAATKNLREAAGRRRTFINLKRIKENMEALDKLLVEGEDESVVTSKYNVDIATLQRNFYCLAIDPNYVTEFGLENVVYATRVKRWVRGLRKINSTKDRYKGWRKRPRGF